MVNLIDWVHFLAMFLITSAIIRLIELKYPDSTISKALGVIH